MNYRLIVALLTLGVGLAAEALAEVKLPSVLGPHMVLQQDRPVPIWGWAAPGEKVTVRFAGQQKSAVADAEGRWSVRLARLAASHRPRTLTVTGAATAVPVELTDVLVGEVWVCSGQSNMAWGLASATNGPAETAAAQFPAMRFFSVMANATTVPLSDCTGEWAVCTPATAAGFSAVGYFFGRELHQRRQVPVGLINTSWGGTVAEAWTSAAALRARLPEFAGALEALGGADAAAYHEKLARSKAAREKLWALEDDRAAAARWAAVDLDDRGWQTMAVPGVWESGALPGFDGLVWFRKTIEVPAAWAGKPLVLRPGPIDEVDVTWFNGVEVGARGNSRKDETQFWDVARDYRVPGALVKAGRNVIAIRVIDAAGAGGLAGASPAEMYVGLADGADPARIPLAGDWRYEVELKLPPNPESNWYPNRPSVLFNAMINPLIPFAMRGVIWYQGESNADRPAQYRTLLPTMIADWRARWGLGEFPFLVVQLANFMARTAAPQTVSGWAELREAQALTAARDPRTGLAVTIDIGDAKDIHPTNKQDVGKRLALAAQAIAYRERMEYAGPTFERMKVTNGRATLTFRHTTGGLVVKGDELAGFAVAGADGEFVWAQARVAGNKVLVWSEAVSAPVAVRYAWGDNPAANLYNGAGLPAVPFRTDGPR